MSKEPLKELILDGNRIHDIPSFYDEVNRVFMQGVDFTLSPNLDAFNDLLHGGFGAIRGKEPITLKWLNFEKNREDLGVEATIAFYRAKLERPEAFNQEWARAKLDELERGEGQTYMDILLDIIGEHPNIKLTCLN
ncbi:barstar family protein [Parapedobacter sp. DT-150]|uniref:barstar family protein n=1 Tax=Parapedobacter sp. DT-150 TaxID=3396162 RepID=UPI003F1998C7